MTYEITIDDNKEKEVIAFLKQLDFVKLRRVKKVSAPRKKPKEQASEIPYFAADVNWDIDAKTLRSQSNKRIGGW